MAHTARGDGQLLSSIDQATRHGQLGEAVASEPPSGRLLEAVAQSHKDEEICCGLGAGRLLVHTFNVAS